MTIWKTLTGGIALMTASLQYSINIVAQTRDLYPDTWVGTDALGRKMPTGATNPLKTDKPRTVGIFYVTWHDEGKYDHISSPYKGDVTRVLAADPSARLDGNNRLWTEPSYHWGEPELGYFLSRDRYVIRRDMSMLADAGVDVLILDATNAVCYWDEWATLLDEMDKMKAEGNAVPSVCFWAFNGNVVKTVRSIYERIYKPGLHRGLWFEWNGKPLLLYNANPGTDASGMDTQQGDYGDDVRSFFTLRNMWWGYYEWNGKRYAGTEDNWCFGYDMNDPRVAGLSPAQRASVHNGRMEEMAVTPAQHSISMVGKSWTVCTGEPRLNARDVPDSAYVPWLGRTVAEPEGYGIYFQDRWDEALKVDPDFIYINDWNEWTAGKYAAGKDPAGLNPGPTEFLGRKSNFYFVDQYNAEFNRTIQPMRGGYTDNYYMQMVQNIRRYKGVRPIPVNEGLSSIRVDGRFDDWKTVKTEYRDTRGDTVHRSHNGYGGLHYTDDSGRNDIITSKVGVGKKSLFFYVETADIMTRNDGDGWMLLFIDADKNEKTGWNGYDYVVNKKVKNSHTTTLIRYDKGQWQTVCTVPYRYKGREMELRIPLSRLNLSSKENVTFDFKWSDNAGDLDNIISLCTKGDTAPDRRFNYRFVWRP